MRDKLYKALSTLFGIGYIPLFPGTIASLAGVGVYFVIRHNAYLYAVAIAALTAAGFILAGRAKELFGKSDPGEVVIDELCGILMAYAFVPFSAANLVIGFLLFRLLDISKIYPLYILEKAGGGRGIMFDDIAAGIITNMVLQIGSRFLWLC